MLKLLRRTAVPLLIVGAVLWLLPNEKTPPTGQWLVRAGLEPRTARIGRLDVRYVRNGQGAPVILVHGLASSIYTWAGAIGPLSETFDVVALDLPGFGQSSQPDDLSFDDLPRTVVGLMDALGIPKAHFVGNSLGGAVSLRIAARNPDRVDRVVVLDSAGLSMEPNERPFIVRLLASKEAGSFAALLPIRRLLVAATLRHLFRDDAKVTDEGIDEYTAPLLRPGALASVRSLLLSPPGDRFLPDLSLIQAKTLVVWGRFDPWLPESHADGFLARIPGASKIVLATGHMPQEEQPAEVARLIGDFLIS